MTEASFDKADFSTANVLVVSGSEMTRKFLADTVRGFGFGAVDVVESFGEGKQRLHGLAYALVLIDAPPDGEDAYDFVRWLRRSELEDNYFIPVLLTAANITNVMLDHARESGIHFIMIKPVSPDAMMKRIQWLAKNDREFVSTDAYCGPDRRFRFEGPPPGTSGRRASDLSATIGVSMDPNLDQGDIDALLKPQKISL